jgi:hypothetical protein
VPEPRGAMDWNNHEVDPYQIRAPGPRDMRFRSWRVRVLPRIGVWVVREVLPEGALNGEWKLTGIAMRGRTQLRRL